MERAVPSLKWKTTASAACIPRRDSTSPYSMAATVFPTASRIVCSLCSGLGGPIILGCSPLLACWLSIRAPSTSCGRPLPSDTAHLTLMCPPSRPSWNRQAPPSSLHVGGGGGAKGETSVVCLVALAGVLRGRGDHGRGRRAWGSSTHARRCPPVRRPPSRPSEASACCGRG